MEKTCSQCGTSLEFGYNLCDKTEGRWCDQCFDELPCGKGAHGEDCPTWVIDV